MSTVEQSLAAYNQGDTLNIDVLTEVVAFIMTNFWWRHSRLVLHKLSNFLIQSVGLLRLRFFGDFSQFALVKLGIVICFLSLHSNEWVKEVFIAYGISLDP